MDQITHTVRSTYWQDILYQCQNRPQDLSAKQWLLQNNIRESNYYYWQRKLRKIAFEQFSPPVQCSDITNDVSFAEIKIPEPVRQASIEETITTDTFTPSAVFKTASMTIAVSNTIGDHLLHQIIKEVSRA
jgi:hypothetical protein